MVVVQSCKVPLPHPSSLSPHPTSILFEPTSLSLAITHFDSSLSLYPSFSPFSLSNPQTLTIPSPSSSSSFLLLQPTPSSIPTVLFLVSSPHRSRILLRFYRLRRAPRPSFARLPRLSCSHPDLRFHPSLGLLLNAPHGPAVRLASHVNYFALHSLSAAKLWLFSLKHDDDNNAGDAGVDGVRLVRCAVLDCSRPVFSMHVAFGFVLLGEENGVRVFGLRRLVKGRSGKSVGNSKQMKNNGGGGGRGGGVEAVNCNGDLQGKIERHGVVAAGQWPCFVQLRIALFMCFPSKVCTSVCGPCSNICLLASFHASWDMGAIQGAVLCLISRYFNVKQTNVKLKHDDRDGGSCFVVLKGNGVETKSTTKVSMSIKAISIQAVSRRMFLILDSHGDLHLLSLSNSGIGVDITGNIRHLPRIMKVQSLAVLPDISTMSQTIWISDGCHSVHMFNAMDIENALSEVDGNDCNEKLMHLPVMRVLFSSEKIQDIISLSANSILILGQGQSQNGGNLSLLEAYMHMQFPEAALIFLSFSVEINIPGSLDVPKCTCVVHRLILSHSALVAFTSIVHP
ncbi:hypothetical protein VNO78_33638 [Psophocarpus tetragonolobus]|uniref:Uncharacterized protein n=1 Tax=Psophocarpus tetragonolobus TaxID=3891 RepID=A0AAN9P2S3_PSOTE